MQRKSKAKKQVNMSVIGMTLLKANIMAYMLTAIFILLASIILTYTSASGGFEKWIVAIGMIISAFLAGFDTAKVDTKNGYKWGMIGGSFYFFIFLILGIFLNGLKGINIAALLMIAIAILLSSCIAGMVSVNCQK